MSRRPVQSLVIFHKLQAQGPMRTPDLAREVGTPTVCMRALLSYLARRPTPLVERVRPGVWQASRTSIHPAEKSARLSVMPLGLPINIDALKSLCRRYRVTTLELFGSRAKGTAEAASDVDLLVTFDQGRTPGLAFVTFAEELEALFGRHVDLLVRDTVERDENPTRRASILARTELLYAA